MRDLGEENVETVAGGYFVVLCFYDCSVVSTSVRLYLRRPVSGWPTNTIYIALNIVAGRYLLRSAEHEPVVRVFFRTTTNHQELTSMTSNLYPCTRLL